ncbi:MAG: hypothetical protein JO025_05525 [Verrucomicrobia bacterium]|nr:hypothetical protein [Verrucomicrobiota bacterium]
MRPTQVIADHRESKSGVGKCLAALPDVRLQWEKLLIGDYIVGAPGGEPLWTEP